MCVFACVCVCVSLYISEDSLEREKKKFNKSGKQNKNGRIPGSRWSMQGYSDLFQV